MVRQDEVITTRLPSGYQLLVVDSCVVVMRREDGTTVSRFTNNVDPEELRRATEISTKELQKPDGRIPTSMFSQSGRRYVL
jgi:hypothetical protein